MKISIRNISKTFGNFKALNDVSLNIADGELVALLGPSGSGKTTLLRIIAGLEYPDSGSILFFDDHGNEIASSNQRVGFVFQHFALFRHMTIFENIAFGLRVLPKNQRPSKTEIKDKVNSLLKLVQLDWLANRYPSQLSGGQRQRVALARALAVEPKVMLLDEPFGSLDARVRSELRRWLRKLHDDLHITSVFVTHDQEEALEVADRVALINEGRLEQIGTPSEVYDHPVSPFVYEFLGTVNLFHGRANQGVVTIGNFHLDAPEFHDIDDEPALAYVRPHDLILSRQKETDVSIEANVTRIRRMGALVRIELKAGETRTVEAQIPVETMRDLNLKIGENVWVRPRRVRIFIDET